MTEMRRSLFTPYNSVDQKQASSYTALYGKRLLLLATGCIGTMYLPMWMAWLRDTLEEIEVQVVLTATASDFVGQSAVHAFCTRPPAVDSWAEQNGAAAHIQLHDWADCILVHPASMHFVSRLANGLCDTPTMLALQGVAVPTVVAAAAPPGFTNGAAWRRYADLLAERPNIMLLEPNEGFSAVNSKEKGNPAVPFPTALQTLADRMGTQ